MSRSRRQASDRPSVSWGAVLVGAVAGLGLTAVAALGLFAFGVRPDVGAGSVAFIFVQFSGLFIAGLVGGRFARPNEARHGSLAALGLYLVTALLTVVTGGDPGVATILFSAIVALVLGAAGGVLSAQLTRG